MVLVDASEGDGLARFAVGIHMRKARLQRALDQVGVHSAPDLFGAHNAVGGMAEVMGQTGWFVPVRRPQLKAVASEAFKDSS